VAEGGGGGCWGGGGGGGCGCGGVGGDTNEQKITKEAVARELKLVQCAEKIPNEGGKGRKEPKKKKTPTIKRKRSWRPQKGSVEKVRRAQKKFGGDKTSNQRKELGPTCRGENPWE